MNSLFDVLRSYDCFTGGFICIVARMETIKKSDEYKNSFFPMCDKLETDGKWSRVKRESCSYMAGVEGICICYRVS